MKKAEHKIAHTVKATLNTRAERKMRGGLLKEQNCETFGWKLMREVI